MNEADAIEIAQSAVWTVIAAVSLLFVVSVSMFTPP